MEVVEQPAAEQVITQFLGQAPKQLVTPPLDAYGSPVTVPSATATSAPSSSGGGSGTTTTTTVPGTGPFNPTPC